METSTIKELNRPRPNILHVILKQMPRLQSKSKSQQSCLVENIHKKIDINNIKMNKEQQQSNEGPEERPDERPDDEQLEQDNNMVKKINEIKKQKDDEEE
jgi:hypothetical protein